jgi:hypothetical protein
MKGVKLSQKAMRVKSFEKGVVRMFMAATGEATLGGRPGSTPAPSPEGRTTRKPWLARCRPGSGSRPPPPRRA